MVAKIWVISFIFQLWYLTLDYKITGAITFNNDNNSQVQLTLSSVQFFVAAFIKRALESPERFHDYRLMTFSVFWL